LQTELIRTSLSQRERAEELAAQYKAAAAKSDEQLQTAQHEARRLDAALKRCASEIQQYRAKIKTKNEVLLRQEAAVSAVEETAHTLQTKTAEWVAVGGSFGWF
jgi:chromosome segregation ATPase